MDLTLERCERRLIEAEDHLRETIRYIKEIEANLPFAPDDWDGRIPSRVMDLKEIEIERQRARDLMGEISGLRLTISTLEGELLRARLARKAAK